MARPRSPEGGCESQGDSRLPEVPRHLLAPRPVSPPFAGPPGLCSVVKPRGVQAHGLEHFSTSGEMKRLVADPSLIVASPCLVFLGLLATLPSPGGGGGDLGARLQMCPSDTAAGCCRDRCPSSPTSGGGGGRVVRVFSYPRSGICS